MTKLQTKDLLGGDFLSYDHSLSFGPTVILCLGEAKIPDCTSFRRIFFLDEYDLIINEVLMRCLLKSQPQMG